MTKRPTGSRAVMMVAGMAMATMATAQPDGIDVTVAFEGGAVIPEGRVEIYLDDPSSGGDARRRGDGAYVESGGKSKTLDVFLPTGAAGSPAREIVAVLEREDGWMLARGSATFEGHSSVRIVLDVAMY